MSEENLLRLAPEPVKSSAKHSVTFDGFTYDLKLHPTPCGVDAQFVRELSEDEKKKMHPLQQMFGGNPGFLVSEHIHPKWWWPFLGRTVEKEIERFVFRIQKDAKNYADNKQAVTRFLQ